MKKIISLVLCITMILSIFSIVPFSTSAKGVNTAQVSNWWSGDYNCELLSDNTVEIIAYGGYDSDVVVPDTIDGYTVTSVGETAFLEDVGITSVSIPDTVKHVGDSAFCECSGLESVSLGESVTNIESNAFADCPSLKSITLPNSVTNLGGEVFSLCSALESVEISENLTNIPDGTFEFCTSLKEITIPDGIKSIGVGAFGGCTNLSKINSPDGTTNIIPDCVTDIADMAFDNCTSLNNITIPSGVKNIGNWAFGFYQQEQEKVDGFTITGYPDTAAYRYARNNGFKFISLEPMPTYEYDVLEDSTAKITQYNGTEEAVIEIPSTLDTYTVTQIGDSAFKNHGELESVTIPESVVSVGSSAFMDCGKITKVTIPDGVESIGDRAFYGNVNLKNVTIPASVENIDVMAFGYYYSYDGYGEDVRVDGFSITGYMNSQAFEYANTNGFNFISLDPIATYEYDVLEDGTAIITQYNGTEDAVIEIPSTLDTYTVTQIGDSAFKNHGELESVTIPESVVSIGSSAFMDCGKIAKVTIPDGVESIGDRAFYGMANLQYVNIPASVTKIDELAFGYYWNFEDTKVNNFTIYGEENTAAQRYADDNGFEFKAIKEPVIENFRATPAESGVRLDWDAFDGASRYVIYIQDGDAWKRYSSTSRLSLIYKKAEEGETYTFNIVAVDANGKVISQMLDEGITYTYNKGSVEFKFAASIDDGIRIEWNAYEGAARYLLYVWENDGWKKFTSTSNLAVTYKNVEDGETYLFNAVPIDENGNKLALLSEDGISCTYKEANYPETFKGKNVEAGIRLDWSAMEGASRYVVYYKEVGTDNWIKFSSTSNTAITFRAAEENVTYVFSLRALDENGNFISGYAPNGPTVTRESKDTCD